MAAESTAIVMAGETPLAERIERATQELTVSKNRGGVVYALPTPQEMTILETMATNAANSRLIQNFNGIPGVMLVMLYARELGIPPMTAVNRGFHNVQGALRMSAWMMQIRIQQFGHEFEPRHLDYESCTVWGKRGDNGKEWEETYLMDDARRAQLVKKDSSWEKTPKDMLFAAGIRVLCRRLFPEVLGPGLGEGEVVDIFDEGGNLVSDAPPPLANPETVTKAAGTKGRKKRTALPPEDEKQAQDKTAAAAKDDVTDAEFTEVPADAKGVPDQQAESPEVAEEAGTPKPEAVKENEAETPAPETEPSQEETAASSSAAPQPDPKVAEFLDVLKTYLLGDCTMNPKGMEYVSRVICEKFGVPQMDLVPATELTKLREFCRDELLHELEMESWIPRSREEE